MTTTISEADFTPGAIHGHRYTNLGPGFKLDLPGATTITVHRRGEGTPNGSREPSIDWINTYGNVTANNGRYTFTPSGAITAAAVLNSIEAKRNPR